MTLENPEPFEPEELSWKEKLAERFHDRPLLRLLILNWPFRLAFFGMIGVVLAVAILLPKIWPALPEDFSPQIKISLLDKIQAWSLKRGARSAERSGDFDLALSGWRSAWANNPGDVEALRGVARAFPCGVGWEQLAGRWLGCTCWPGRCSPDWRRRVCGQRRSWAWAPR